MSAHNGREKRNAGWQFDCSRRFASGCALSTERGLYPAQPFSDDGDTQGGSLLESNERATAVCLPACEYARKRWDKTHSRRLSQHTLLTWTVSALSIEPVSTGDFSMFVARSPATVRCSLALPLVRPASWFSARLAEPGQGWSIGQMGEKHPALPIPSSQVL
jgi:hypothetical protein